MISITAEIVWMKLDLSQSVCICKAQNDRPFSESTQEKREGERNLQRLWKTLDTELVLESYNVP